ncbi:hypothetical protein [Paenibacillus sp. LHD-38]|uniref:hypothetical protein n=1 Tax=Paenibacillus sp. LHD-38 TaxID=3072143 RepID=UPI0028100CCB|nr:hypothetical protein [Paenibacillus sp. LHD-38]MDQ8736156.1 hypothetical protein [Paenibacillus sp. LHD-38]
MGRIIKRLLLLFIVILLLLGGAAWWMLSYIAPDEQLDLSYEPIDVNEKVLAMVKKLKPELVLTEADINDLIKRHLKEKYASGEAGSSSVVIAQDTQLDGASFELEEKKLIAHMNVTYMGRIPAALEAEYSLEWQSPNIVLRPQSLSLKNTSLPVNMLETINVPLDLPAQDIVTVRDMQFLKDQIKVLFKLQLELRL